MSARSELDEFTKSGFNRLLKPFGENLEDVSKITKAFGMAIRAYSGTTKKVGQKVEPYINHPLRVSLILSEELKKNDADLVCAALLHDALAGADDSGHVTTGKQSKISESEVMEQLGERVCNIITPLAKSNEPAAGGFKEQENNSKYFQALKESHPDTRYVKVAETLDNVRSMKNFDRRDKMLRYKDETQKYIVPIAEKTDERLVFKLSVALYELK